MNITLRLEQPEDYRIVEEVTREAFWGTSQPACDEHLLAHKLRKSSAFVPELDFVAELDGQIVGNIMYSKAKIIGKNETEHEVLTFGPLSILPEYQKQGIGAKLVNHTIREAKKLEYCGIVIFGHPDYYPKFGFKNAEEYGITTAEDKNFDAFMALPLYDNAFDNIKGKFHENPVFHMKKSEVKKFDSTFPYKEEKSFIPINALLIRLAPNAQNAINEHHIMYLHVLNTFSGREIASWKGMDKESLDIINLVLQKYGLPKKNFC